MAEAKAKEEEMGVETSGRGAPKEAQGKEAELKTVHAKPEEGKAKADEAKDAKEEKEEKEGEAATTEGEEKKKDLPISLPVAFALHLDPGPKWRVMRELGSGNFGKVLCVGRKREPTGAWDVAGMKIGIGENEFQTKWEGFVLAYLKQLGQTSGVIRYVAHGSAQDAAGKPFPFVCMEILHPTCPTLGSLVKVERDKKLDVGKATRIGIQMLAGLFTLHKVGLVHRDLKPDNVGILAAPNDHSCVLIDLGMARFYTDGEGDVREPRTYPGQKGTPTFMSHRVVSWRDGSRVDDLWSWFYTLVELMKGEMLLPWDEMSFTADEFEQQHLLVKSARFPADHLLKGLPEHLYAIRLHLLGLAWEDAPDYAFLFSALHAILNRFPKLKPTDPIPPYRK